jgi:hypothetical protein
LVAVHSLLLRRRRAIQEMLIAAPGAARRVAALVDDFDPDTVLVHTVRMVQHLPPATHRVQRRVLLHTLLMKNEVAERAFLLMSLFAGSGASVPAPHPNTQPRESLVLKSQKLL